MDLIVNTHNSVPVSIPLLRLPWVLCLVIDVVCINDLSRFRDYPLFSLRFRDYPLLSSILVSLVLQLSLTVFKCPFFPCIILEFFYESLSYRFLGVSLIVCVINSYSHCLFKLLISLLWCLLISGFRHYDYD